MKKSLTRTGLKLIFGLTTFCLGLGLAPVDLAPNPAGSFSGVAALGGIAEGSARCGGVGETAASLLYPGISAEEWGLDQDCDGPPTGCPFK